MDIPITLTPAPAQGAEHSTPTVVPATPRAVLIAARALGMSAAEVRMRLPEDAIDRLARELCRQET